MTISDVEIITESDPFGIIEYVKFKYDGTPYQAKIQYSANLSDSKVGAWKEIHFDPYVTPGVVVNCGPRLLEIIISPALMAKHGKPIKVYKTDDPIEKREPANNVTVLRKECKEVNLNIRCTRQQRNKCKERAKEAGLSLSAWIIERCC